MTPRRGKESLNFHLLRVHHDGAGDGAHLLRRCAQLGAAALLLMPGCIYRAGATFAAPVASGAKLPRLLRNKCARNEAKEAYHPGPTICTTRLLPQHPGKPHRRSGFAGGGFACTRRLVTVVGQRAQQELVHAKVSSSLSPHLHRRACVGRHVHREIG